MSNTSVIFGQAIGTEQRLHRLKLLLFSSHSNTFPNIASYSLFLYFFYGCFLICYLFPVVETRMHQMKCAEALKCESFPSTVRRSF